MTIKQPGSSLSFQEIEDEFGGSGVIGINEYYGADLYNSVPQSGTIAVDDFYSTSVRTTKLTLGRIKRKSSDTDFDHARYGYAASGKSNYWHFEGSAATGGVPDTTGFGSSTRTSSLITSGTFLGFQAIEYSTASGQSSTLKTIEVMTTRTTNGGFTTINFKIGSPSTTTIYSLSRASAGGFAPQFGSYEPGSPDISGVYKWIWGSTAAGNTYTQHPSSLGGVSSGGGGSSVGIDTIYNAIVTAYNNSDPIYLKFS